MTKKIITFTTYDSIGNPYYNGGGATAIHEVAKRLAKDYVVNVICGYYPGATDRVIDGVNYKYIGIPHRIFGQLSFLILHTFHALKTRPSLIIESFTPPFSISLLPLFTKIPVVGLVHMLGARDMERKYHLPFTWIENIGLTWYHHFIVLSEYWKSILRASNTSASYAVIPNAVANPTTKVSKPGNYFLFLGRIEIDQKGIDLLLSAWDTLAISSRLVIAGSGSESEVSNLLTKINALKNAKSVSYIGHIQGSKKTALISRAIATIIPSRYETFSMTALESLAAGTPIISFDIPGMDWISSDSSLRARAFDTDSLADKIRLIGVDPQLRTKMSQSAKVESKKYNFNQIIKKYVKLIEELT